MSDPVETFLDSQKPMLKVVNEILDSWDRVGCYQVPILLLNVGAKLNWNKDDVRKYDPLVRLYLKDHPVWYVTRGAGGGIMLRSEFQKKVELKAAKELAKEKIKADIQALTNSKMSASTTVVDDTEDNINSNE